MSGTDPGDETASVRPHTGPGTKLIEAGKSIRVLQRMDLALALWTTQKTARKVEANASNPL